MKTFEFFMSAEQENGDQLPLRLQIGIDRLGKSLDGFDLKMSNDFIQSFLQGGAKIPDPIYTVTQGGEDLFSFKILSAAPGMIPPAVVLRELGDIKEGTLES